MPEWSLLGGRSLTHASIIPHQRRDCYEQSQIQERRCLIAELEARLLCLLLVLTMLPINAFASDIIVPGSGGTSPGSGGGGSGTKWSSPTNLGPGMLLHVQSSERTVTFDYTDPANVVSKGYDEVVKYWTTHFPNTDPDSKQTGIYLLPTWIKSNYDQSAIQFKKNGTLD